MVEDWPAQTSSFSRPNWSHYSSALGSFWLARPSSAWLTHPPATWSSASAKGPRFPELVPAWISLYLCALGVGFLLRGRWSIGQPRFRSSVWMCFGNSSKCFWEYHRYQPYLHCYLLKWSRNWFIFSQKYSAIIIHSRDHHSLARG